MISPQENDERIIKAIYVFNEGGTCLVKYTSMPKGQMSLAIMNTLENSIESLKNSTAIETGRSLTNEITKVYHRSKQDIVFAMICSEKLPERAASYLLDKISHKFINMYSGRLKVQNGNSEKYEAFQQILEGCCYSPYIKILMKEFDHQ